MRKINLSWAPGIAIGVMAILVVGLLALACTGGDDPVMAPESTPTDATEQARSDQPEPGQPQAGTPASLPVVKPPGYHHGIEHGIAVVQTTRESSREGWVDITLVIAAVKFDGLLSTIEFRHEPSAICLVTQQAADDCLVVAWGSEEQFEAELDSEAPDEFDLPAGKSWLLDVTFEIASNATKASLFFGDDTQIALNLAGDLPVPEAPTKPAPVGPVAGYFADSQYGISVVGVRRERSDSVGSWIYVDLEVISTSGPEELTAVVRSEAIGGDACFVGDAGNECLSVRWGNQVQFNQILRFGGDEVRWPRGLGWPTTIEFPVPNNVDSATIEFGSHQIPIALGGMEGVTPAYDYRSHYPEIQPGMVMYDSNRKMVVVEEVRQVKGTGEVALVLNAINNSEATDFAPRLALAGSRVSRTGKFFDGLATKWTPNEVWAQPDNIPPGGSNEFAITVPRSWSPDEWGFVEYSPDSNFRPDAVVAMITIDDALSEASPQSAEPGHIRFERTADEEPFYPRWGEVVWRYEISGPVYTPVVWEGMVYVRDGNGDLHALDAVTGTLDWTANIPKPRYDAWLPPLVEGGALWVHSNTDVYAFDARTGRLFWQYDAYTRAYPPVVQDKVAYISRGQGQVAARHFTDGYKIWFYNYDQRYRTDQYQLAVLDGVVYVGTWDEYIYALDARSGELLWRRHLGFDLYRPVAADGMIYAADNNSVIALDAANGELVWRERTGGDVSRPVVADGVIYVGSDDDHAYALKASTGEVLWRYETGDNVLTPVVEGDVVYFRSDDGNVYALDRRKGSLFWQLEHDDYVYGPAVHGDLVFVGSADGHLYAHLVPTSQ